ncbi:IS3 family transposase [Paraburkholderia sp. RAU2J]|uniref:IS3 family transposase n=1 Tax=Paraburkholderia sp. RAU2J TaxID=1938810 RepID=UPI000EAEB595|nr:IS3 family transposase [Paraburkholderia sp. RAU2J]
MEAQVHPDDRQQTYATFAREHLKMERVWQRQYANHDEARRDINPYIVAFYNPVRLHSTLGYLSPAAYEARPTAKETICLSEIS